MAYSGDWKSGRRGSLSAPFLLASGFAGRRDGKQAALLHAVAAKRPVY